MTFMSGRIKLITYLFLLTAYSLILIFGIAPFLLREKELKAKVTTPTESVEEETIFHPSLVPPSPLSSPYHKGHDKAILKNTEAKETTAIVSKEETTAAATETSTGNTISPHSFASPSRSSSSYPTRSHYAFLLKNQTNNTTPTEWKEGTATTENEILEWEALLRKSVVMPNRKRKGNHTSSIWSNQTNTTTTIDRIYYINMEKNTHRRVFMESWLQKLKYQENQSGSSSTVKKHFNIPYQRVNAIRGQKSGCVPRKSFPVERCMGLSGLLFTNQYIIDRLNVTGHTLVLEDDYEITDMNLLIQSIKLVPTDWDIIRWQCGDYSPHDVTRTTFPFVNDFCFRSAHVTPCPDTINTTIKTNQEEKVKIRKSPCLFCGGTHIMLWRDTSVAKLRRIWSQETFDDIDCRLSTWDLKSYCINYLGVGNLRRFPGEEMDIPKKRERVSTKGMIIQANNTNMSENTANILQKKKKKKKHHIPKSRVQLLRSPINRKDWVQVNYTDMIIQANNTNMWENTTIIWYKNKYYTPKSRVPLLRSPIKQ